MNLGPLSEPDCHPEFLALNCLDRNPVSENRGFQLRR